jgi:hypothetical protein
MPAGLDRADGPTARSEGFIAAVASPPGALSKGEYEAGLEAAGFEQISIEFTHDVADGMHGAIVKAVKAGELMSKNLQVIPQATRSCCC